MWKKVAAGVLLTAIVIGIYVEVTHANLDLLFRINPLALVASIALLIISDLVRAYRLEVLSGYVNCKLSLKESVVVWEASRLFALLTPGFYGGEVLRIGYITKKYDLARGVVVNILEITSEMAAVSVNAILSFLMLYLLFGSKVNVTSLTISLLISIGMLAASLVVQLTKRCPNRPQRIKNYCITLLEVMRVAGFEAFSVAFAISLVGVVVYVASVAVIARALDVNALVSALVFACSLPITVVPITPGGVGLPETLAALSLPTLASVLVIWRIVNILTVLSSSLFAITLYGKDLLKYVNSSSPSSGKSN